LRKQKRAAPSLSFVEKSVHVLGLRWESETDAQRGEVSFEFDQLVIRAPKNVFMRFTRSVPREVVIEVIAANETVK